MVTTAPTAAAVPTVTFERKGRSPSPQPLPHVEIEFPIAEQRIWIQKASRYAVRLAVEHWPLGKDGAAVQLCLDDHPPHLVTSLHDLPRLGELVPEDRVLEAGAHRLFAVAVRGNGETVKPTEPTSRAPYATVRFHLGERGRPEADSARIVYSQPRGTFNGQAAADCILVDFYLLGVALGEATWSVQVRVEGRAGSWMTRVHEWQPLWLHGLPSGDYDVSLQLVSPDGVPADVPGGRVERTVTVNRDAPLPEAGES